MDKDYIKNGDIVRFDYITEFTKEHIIYDALILWKDYNQPLILVIEDLKNGLYIPRWTCYKYISKIIGHIDLYKLLLNNIECLDNF